MLFGLTGTYKASAIAAAGNAESRSPREITVSRDHDLGVSPIQVPHTRIVRTHTCTFVCKRSSVGTVVELRGWMVGSLEGADSAGNVPTVADGVRALGVGRLMTV